MMSKPLGFPVALTTVVALLLSTHLQVHVQPATPSSLPAAFEPHTLHARHIKKVQAPTAFAVLSVCCDIIEAHEEALASPKRWCAPPRRPERLLNEAARIAWGHETDPDPDGLTGDMNFVRNYLLIWRMHIEKHDVFLVRDESLCERAARLYDANAYSRSRPETQTAFNPVVLVKMGPFYLVDDRRPRRSHYWGVDLYDSDWKYATEYGMRGD